MSTCRSCGQQIDWVKTVHGKNMPVDGDYIPYDDADIGTVIITDGGNVYKVAEGRSYPTVEGRVSHFSTCPQAEEWRKK